MQHTGGDFRHSRAASGRNESLVQARNIRFGPPALGNIGEYHHGSDDLALFVAHRCRCVVHWETRPVLAPEYFSVDAALHAAMQRYINRTFAFWVLAAVR